MRDKPVAKLKLLMKDGSIDDAILYCHKETTTIGGVTYFLAKNGVPADAGGLLLSADMSTTGYIPFTSITANGYFVMQLTGVSSILAATIYATYRCWKDITTGAVKGDISILIRKNDGTVRATLATNVSESAAFTTTETTRAGANYNLAQYNVVDQTDWLEIDYIAHVTTLKAGNFAELYIDDSTYALADQTRSQDWSFGAAAVAVARGDGSTWVVALCKRPIKLGNLLQNLSLEAVEPLSP